MVECFSAHFTIFIRSQAVLSQNRLAEQASEINNKGVNVPNAITLARVPLIFAIGFFFYASFAGSKTLAFILYVLTGITDWLDGWAARKYHQISDFGKLADALIDCSSCAASFLSPVCA